MDRNIKINNIKINKINNIKNINAKQLKKIHHEYRLKQAHFNPTNPSPNLFVRKLEFRMKKYYNTLINEE